MSGCQEVWPGWRDDWVYVLEGSLVCGLFLLPANRQVNNFLPLCPSAVMFQQTVARDFLGCQPKCILPPHVVSLRFLVEGTRK